MKREGMPRGIEGEMRDFTPKKLFQKEKELLAKYGKEAGRLAKVLLLVSGLALGACDKDAKSSEPDAQRNMDEHHELSRNVGQSVEGMEGLPLRVSAGNFETQNLLDLFAEKSVDDPAWILVNVNLYKDAHILGFDLVRVVDEASEKFPAVFFENIKDIKTIKGLDLVKLIELGEVEAPWAFLRAIQDIIDIPGLDLVRLTEHASEIESTDFLDNIENIKNIKGVNIVRLVENAEKNETRVFLGAVENLKNIPGLDLAKLIEHALESEQNQSILLQRIEHFKDIPKLDLAKLVMKVLGKNFHFYDKNPAELKNLANIPGLDVSKVIERITELSPGFIFERAEFFKDIPGLNLGVIYEKSAKEVPWYFLQSIKNVKGIAGPNVGKMTDKAALAYPSNFVDNINDFQDIPGFDRIKTLNRVLEKYPFFVFPILPQLKDTSGVDVVKYIEQAVEGHPWKIYNNLYLLKKVNGLNLAEMIENTPNDMYPSFFFSLPSLKDIPGLDLAKMIRKFYKVGPSFFLSNIRHIIDIPGLDLVKMIKSTYEDEPKAFLGSIDYIKEIPGFDKDGLVGMIEIAGKKDLGAFLFNIDKIKYIIGVDLVTLIENGEKAESGTFLGSVKDMTDIIGLDLVPMIDRASLKSPRHFLYNFTDVQKLIPNANLVILIDNAATKTPGAFLNFAKNLLDIPNLNLGELVEKSAVKDLGSFVENAKFFKDVPGIDFNGLFERASVEVSNSFIRNFYTFSNFKGINFSKMIEVAGMVAPNEFIQFGVSFRGVPDFNLSLVTEKVLQNSPGSLMGYNARSVLKDRVKEPQLKSTIILEKLKNPKVGILLHDMLNNGLSEEEAWEIVSDKTKLFQALNRIQAEPNYLGKKSVDDEIRNMSLVMVRDINDLHSETDDVRFKSVENLPPNQIYNFMVNGEEEIFTSSFNGLFNRLLKKMDQDEISGSELLKQVGPDKSRIFVKECAGFNRLNEFLATMSDIDAQELLAGIVKGLDSVKNNLAQATTVADIFSMVKDEQILKILQEEIKKEFERVDNTPEAPNEAKAIYGILSGMFGEKAVVDKEWFKDKMDKFGLEDVTKIESNDLFNQDGSNVQQYYFYDDPDGEASFASFMSQYENKAGWKVEKKKNFVVIKSTKNDRKIEIYANFPKAEGEGVEEIEKLLSTRNIEKIVVVHRGHSFHAQKTIDRISPMAKIVSLGSCGGYNNVEGVLDKSANVHIISTKGTGTMLVNDPLLRMLNEQILSGNDIDWPEFWEKAEAKLGNNPNFGDYVPPHKNLGVMFLKAYRNSLDNSNKGI